MEIVGFQIILKDAVESAELVRWTLQDHLDRQKWRFGMAPTAVVVGPNGGGGDCAAVSRPHAGGESQAHLRNFAYSGRGFSHGPTWRSGGPPMRIAYTQILYG